MTLPYDNNRREETSDNCDLACPFIYFPVCGTDGQTYKVFSNDCSMGRQSCLDGKGEWQKKKITKKNEIKI